MKKVIIIGAGILGATTAYHLARQGVNVKLIDRQDTGQATEAAAGIICPWLAQRRNKAWYHLASNGAKIYPELINELIELGENDTGYKQVGAIRLHTDKSRLLEAQKRILNRRLDAPEIGEVSMLDEAATNKLIPVLDPSFQSLHVSGAARVDGSALRNALLRAAKKFGAKFINGDASLLTMNKRVIGVNVNEDTIEADLVIATCGAWMNTLFRPLGIHFSVYPQKAQIIHLELSDSDTSNWPVVMPPNNQYLLTLNKRIIIGATHETKAGFDQRITAGGVQEILAKALEIAPGLANSTFVKAKVGFRPFTPGSLPIIGEVPNLSGVLLANGLGASGLTTGPFVGTQLAKLALDQPLDINLADYDVTKAIKQSLGTK